MAIAPRRRTPHRRRRHGFRFRPPELAPPAELGWVLGAAFARRPPAAPPADADDALELAERLALLPRIALRTDLVSAGARLAPYSEGRLRAERSLAMARELAFEATLEALDAAGRALRVEPILLKGRALVATGYATPGARPSTDIDLLLPERALTLYRRELLANRFRPAGARGYEHQLPPLVDPRGQKVELHRYVPGVRIVDGRSARWEDLVAAGLVRPLGASRLSTPTRELLRAHALVHALSQHGLAAAFPGWLLIADLVDLGDLGAADDEPVSRRPWHDWIARDVSEREAGAALALAARVASGAYVDAPDVPPDVAALGRHFLAAALDPGYGEALKARWLEAPLSEHGPLGARLRLLAGAFVPPAGGAGGPVRRAGRWLGRPFALARKALGARRSARDVERSLGGEGDLD